MIRARGADIDIWRICLVRTGAFLPMSCIFTRVTAEARVFRTGGFAIQDIRSNIRAVVVTLPQWVRTYCLFRYPSLVGRLCAVMHKPPFFTINAELSTSERSIARTRYKRDAVFDHDAQLMLNGVTGQQSLIRGNVSCISDILGHRPLLCSQHLRPAGIQSLNKPRSGLPQASEPRLSYRAALSRAQLSVLRGMSFIARHIRTSVDHLTGGLRFSDHIYSYQDHLRIPRGWSFCIRLPQHSVAPLTSQEGA